MSCPSTRVTAGRGRLHWETALPLGGGGGRLHYLWGAGGGETALPLVGGGGGRTALLLGGGGGKTALTLTITLHYRGGGGGGERLPYRWGGGGGCITDGMWGERLHYRWGAGCGETALQGRGVQTALPLGSGDCITGEGGAECITAGEWRLHYRGGGGVQTALPLGGRLHFMSATTSKSLALPLTSVISLDCKRVIECVCVWGGGGEVINVSSDGTPFFCE